MDVKNSSKVANRALKHAARTLSASAMAAAPSSPMLFISRLIFVTDSLTCRAVHNTPGMSNLEGGYR